MNENNDSIRLRFPSDLDYVPAIRKFVAESALIQGYTEKFSYRTEIIIDELCNNAVKFGTKGSDARVEVVCRFLNEGMDLRICDSGSDQENVKNLQESIESANSGNRFMGRGLEIVKMLSSKVEMVENDKGETEIRVLKNRSQNTIDSIAE